jgi:membrane protein implicated in regulation of membrane protease activity
MTERPPNPASSSRTGYLVAGSVAALIAAVLIAAGALALWGDSKKGADGYLSTGTERFTTATRALQSERVDVEVDNKTWIAGAEDLGDTRLKVAPAGGEPVFAGIGPERDVKAYLRGVEHTVLEDIDSSPFSARHVEHGGARAPAAPSKQDFWAASTEGSGPQTLHWTPDEGDWAVVVMNADGSAGVAADVSAGAEVAFLAPLGWSLAGGGVLLLIGGVYLLRRGIRPRTLPAARLAPAGA